MGLNRYLSEQQHLETGIYMYMYIILVHSIMSLLTSIMYLYMYMFAVHNTNPLSIFFYNQYCTCIL